MIDKMQVKRIIVCLILLLFAPSGPQAKKKEITKSALQLLEKDGQIYNAKSCQNMGTSNIRKLEHTNKTDQAVGCLLKYLQSSNSNGWYWSYLGNMYAGKGEKSKATTCFKQAAKLDGKVSKFIKEWHYLGPFVIGKSEVDGDPVEFWGGIKTASRQIHDKKKVYYSELMPGGHTAWKTYTQTATGESVQISPAVNWNDLISSLGSVAISEWQGWVVGEFAVNAREEVSIQCLGVHTVFVDDIFLAADVYRRKDFWFTLELDPGIHRLYIRLRAKASQVFQCNIKSFESESFLLHAPTMVPDIVENVLIGDCLTIPVTNLHGNKWLKNIRVKVSESSAEESVRAFLPKDAGYVSIAPGQTAPLIVHLELLQRPEDGENEGSGDQKSCQDLRFRMQVSVGSVRESYSVPVTLRCRSRHQSFIFSFMDHDGSVQQAAAIEPLQDCPEDLCPVVLTLHGTGVEVQNQADGYKRLENDEWLFGLERAWILASTRHGAHNWEGPGALTSMTALDQLCRLMANVPWMHNKPSPSHVIFAGHSMGGHGAWHLATHYPDRALAVVSLAGWIKKEQYGDSNVFFRHDIGTSHTDPAIKSILEACIAENNADRHVSNLKGVPVMTRIGARDRTVHPYFVRRMYRLLKEQGANVTYTELEGKEHWWWDTWKTNDGGTVNDPQLRDFTNYHATILQLDSQSCDRTDASASCISSSPSDKYSRSLQEGNGDELTLTVINPALGEGLGGVRVEQQIVPLRTSTIKMKLAEANAILTTKNVAKFSVTCLDYIPFKWKSVRIFEVDGIVIQGSKESDETEATTLFCLSDKGVWQICERTHGANEGERSRENYGPARRIAEHRFLIVTGTLQKEITDNLRHLAVYLANLFYLSSDAVAMVIEDAVLSEEMAASYNLIIVGGPRENAHAQQFLKRVPLNFDNHVLSLGRCRYPHSATGALFLAPHHGAHLALVLLGNSLEGLHNAIRLASPTIPPMTRSPFSNMIPDYVITGPDFRGKGSGGYLCAGFWGNRWDYRLETSSCVC